MNRREALQWIAGGIGSIATGTLSVMEVKNRLAPPRELTIPDALRAFGHEIRFDFSRSRIAIPPFGSFLEMQSPDFEMHLDASGGYRLMDQSNNSTVFITGNGTIDLYKSSLQLHPYVKKPPEDPTLQRMLRSEQYQLAIMPGPPQSDIQLFGAPTQQRIIYDRTINGSYESRLWIEALWDSSEESHYDNTVPLHIWLEMYSPVHTTTLAAYAEPNNLWQTQIEEVHDGVTRDYAKYWEARYRGNKSFVVSDVPILQGKRRLNVIYGSQSGTIVEYYHTDAYDGITPVVETMAAEGLTSASDFFSLLMGHANFFGKLNHGGLPEELTKQFPALVPK